MTDDDTPLSRDDPARISRRSFLRCAAGIGAAVPLSCGVFVSGNGRVAPDPWLHGTGDAVVPPPTEEPRHCLGPALWGNPLRILAVANPDVTHEAFADPDEDPVVFDRERRSEGYGIVRVDHDDKAFVVECWPRAVDPTDDAPEQFPGWPYRLPFDETDGRER